MGLKIPGTREGVTVQNGSALQNGIYSALNPSTPIGYARGCNFLIVGVALDPCQQNQVRHHGDWRVFYSNDLVVPVWLFRYETVNTNTGASQTHHKEVKYLMAEGTDKSLVSKYKFIKLHHNLSSILGSLLNENEDLTQEGHDNPQAVSSTLTGAGTVARKITSVVEEGENSKPLPGDVARTARFPTTRDPDVKLREKEIGNKKMSKRLIKQLPRSLKEVYGY